MICQNVQSMEGHTQLFFPPSNTYNMFGNRENENNMMTLDGTYRDLKFDMNMFNSVVLPSLCSFANLENNN